MLRTSLAKSRQTARHAIIRGSESAEGLTVGHAQA